MARLGKARFEAWPGEAGLGKVRLGKAWFRAWLGKARLGKAWRGRVRGL